MYFSVLIVLLFLFKVDASTGHGAAVTTYDLSSDTSFGGFLATLLPVLLVLSLVGRIGTPAIVDDLAPDFTGQLRCRPCPEIPTSPPCPAVQVCLPEVQCPDGFSTINIPNVQSPASCYAYRSGSVTAIQASNECRKLGGNLWTFETSEEFDAVTTNSKLERPYITGNSNAFNDPADLDLSNVCNGASPPIPPSVTPVTAISGQCNFMTVKRNAGNNRYLGRVTCSGIADIGYVCEADITIQT